MKAVITGDIINSQSVDAKVWYQALMELFSSVDPKKWEIYRGDEFQYLVDDATNAFTEVLKIKSKIKKISGLDVRMSIGLGEQNFVAEKVSQSNGSAFVNSGRNFETIKTDKINLIIGTGDNALDQQLNLLFCWVSLSMDNWSMMSAEIIDIFLNHPDSNQEEVAKQLEISQSSVSQRLKRANYDLLIDTDDYFRNLIAAR